MADHLDGHLFAIPPRRNPANSVSSLSSTSTAYPKRNRQMANYRLEITACGTKSSSASTWSTDLKDEKGQEKEEQKESLSREPIKSRLGAFFSSISPGQQDLLSQFGFLLALIGVLVLVMYYELTSYADSGFEQFMNSQNLGVRALFTAIGLIISLFWDYYSSGKSPALTLLPP